MEGETRQIRKYFSRFGWRFVLGTAVIFAAQFLTAAIVGRTHAQWLEDGNASLLLSAVPMYLIGMPVLIWLLRGLPGGQIRRRSMSAGQFAVAALMCYAIMYGCNILGTMVAAFVGMFRGSAVENPLTDVLSAGSLPVIFVLAVICAPLYEEYIFRKLIIDKTVRYGQGVAVLLSGLLFGLFHGNLNQFAYAFGLGLFLAFLYVKTGDLRITIGLHMLVNFISGVVSMLVLRQMPIDAMEAALQSGDARALMNVYMDAMGAVMLLLGYVCVIFCVAIAGFVLLILYRRRFWLEPGEADIPKGQRFVTVFLNPGMAVFVLFWSGLIFYRLFWG